LSERSARWSYAATRTAPGEGRRAVGEFAASAGATARALGAIAVCVSEAVTNVVVHAYRYDDRPGSVEVEAEIDGDALCVRVRDQGRGLEPRLDSPGLGLGIPLMAQLSAGLEILAADSGGTEVTMRFDLREQEG
jgi:anti-sigma regulatory factor (Ser/Thr protein kinase)